MSDLAAEEAEWATIFEKQEVKGTLVVLDERQTQAKWLIHDEKRAGERFCPASTFKIPHTLFALDNGVLKDEFQVFSWDGKKRGVAAWNKDQTLRSAMRCSAVWVFEDFAREIGEKKEEEYLRKINYGSVDLKGTPKGTPFWLNGHLTISAKEQVAFLRKLYRNELPFAKEHQRLVKDVMIAEAGHDWILRAKTGWDLKVGWWVGWVERPEGVVFFALNIDTPKRGKDAPKREGVTREILQKMKLLPAKPER